MKEYIEERAVALAHYIIENNATVRQAAGAFGVSKSTVHMVVMIWNGGEVRLFGWLSKDKHENLIIALLKCHIVLYNLYRNEKEGYNAGT